MRWKAGHQPGGILWRIKTRLLLLPMKISGEWRWLERASWKEWWGPKRYSIWVPDKTIYGWTPVTWEDEEETQ